MLIVLLISNTFFITIENAYQLCDFEEGNEQCSVKASNKDIHGAWQVIQPNINESPYDTDHTTGLSKHYYNKPT